MGDDLVVEVVRGAPVRCYATRPTSVVEVLQDALAAGRADDVLLVDPALGRTVTYGQFARLVEGAAATLRERCAPGDRVAFLGRNGLEAALVIWACARAGLVHVGLPVDAPPARLADLLALVGPSLVLVQPGLPLDGEDAALLLAREQDWDARAPLPDEDATYSLIPTSGTTGRPKAVRVTGRMTGHAAVFYARTLGLGPRDRTAIHLPFAWVSGHVTQLTPAMLSGGSAVTMATFSAPQLVEVCREHGVTWIDVVPAIFETLLRTPGFHGAGAPDRPAGGLRRRPRPARHARPGPGRRPRRAAVRRVRAVRDLRARHLPARRGRRARGRQRRHGRAVRRPAPGRAGRRGRAAGRAGRGLGPLPRGHPRLLGARRRAAHRRTAGCAPATSPGGAPRASSPSAAARSTSSSGAASTSTRARSSARCWRPGCSRTPPPSGCPRAVAGQNVAAGRRRAARDDAVAGGAARGGGRGAGGARRPAPAAGAARPAAEPQRQGRPAPRWRRCSGADRTRSSTSLLSRTNAGSASTARPRSGPNGTGSSSTTDVGRALSSASRSPSSSASSTSCVTSTVVVGRSAQQVAEPLVHPQPGLRVERGERLVEQQHRRAGGEHLRDRPALAHPAGQLPRQAVGEALEPGAGQQVADHLGHLRPGGALRARPEGQVVAQGQPGEQPARLRHHPPRRRRAGRPARRPAAPRPTSAGSNPASSRSSVDFPQPDGPEHRQHRAGRGHEVDAAEDQQVAERLGQPAGLERTGAQPAPRSRVGPAHRAPGQRPQQQVGGQPDGREHQDADDDLVGRPRSRGRRSSSRRRRARSRTARRR